MAHKSGRWVRVALFGGGLTFQHVIERITIYSITLSLQGHSVLIVFVNWAVVSIDVCIFLLN